MHNDFAAAYRSDYTAAATGVNVGAAESSYKFVRKKNLSFLKRSVRYVVFHYGAYRHYVSADRTHHAVSFAFYVVENAVACDFGIRRNISSYGYPFERITGEFVREFGGVIFG